MSIVNLNAGDNFAELLEKAQKPVVVDFWAPWCGPCRMLTPELVSVAEELEGSVDIVKVNVDDFADIASEQYKVMSVPTVVFFQNGKEKDRLLGYRPKASLKEFIEKNL